MPRWPLTAPIARWPFQPICRGSSSAAGCATPRSGSGTRPSGNEPDREIKDETLTRRRSHPDRIPRCLGHRRCLWPAGRRTDPGVVDKWVWPMTFRDRSLLINVKYARHALSIDDDRRTFFRRLGTRPKHALQRLENPDLPVDRLL